MKLWCPRDRMWTDDVICGLRAELAATSEFEEFVIRRVEHDGSVRKVFVKLDAASGRLDESLEGSETWWPGPPKGAADVLSVVTEEEQLNLRYVDGPIAGRRSADSRFTRRCICRRCWICGSARQCGAISGRVENNSLREPAESAEA